jgi:hypothetical protein
MSDLGRQIGNLSPARKQLLERLLRREPGGAARAAVIAPRGLTRAPLSFAQRRLWVLDRMAPGGNSFNSPAAYRLTGPLDAAVLERCFGEIARRHEILRTTFDVEGDEPVQVIREPRPPALPVESLEQLAEGGREAEARRLWAEEARLPFDLAAGPLFRLRLLRLAPRDHILLITWHHIITDGWSFGVLVAELTRLYDAYERGLPSPLPELPIQYADFALWQRERLRGEGLEVLLDYWRRRLSQPPTLELPTDRPRPAARGQHAERHPFALPPDLSDALRELCRAENVTPFMLLLAAFQLLLSRYAGQTDISVGTDIAGRRPSETEPLIGFFVNQLVLRTDLSGDPTFRELLARVREVCLGAYAHQDLPFDQLVQELKPERAANRHPLFQVKLVLQNFPRTGAGSDELKIEPLELRDRTPQLLDLVLFVWDRAQGFEGRLQYDTDLFDAATVERMLGRFESLLRQAAERPDARVESYELLTAGEVQQRRQESEERAESNRLRLRQARRKTVEG